VRKKFFIAQKAVRISIGICAGTIVAAGFLAVFYASNETFPYNQNLSTNYNLALKNGVYTKEDRYLADADQGVYAQKRARIKAVFDAAPSRNLIGGSDFSGEFKGFLSELEGLSNQKLKLPSVIEHDEYVKELATLFSAILVKSDSLSYMIPEEFELKKRIYALAGDVCYSMDGTGSFEGTRARATLTSEILKRVYQFQTDTVASSVLKDQLFSTCVPKLRIPCDVKFMFRFEFMRVENMIEVSNGRLKFDPKSSVFQRPKSLSFSKRILRTIPAVESAWHSRFYEFYGLAIAKAFSDPGYTDGVSVCLADLNHYLNPKNDEYLYTFGANLAELGNILTENNCLIYKIDVQQKQDKLITLPTFL